MSIENFEKVHDKAMKKPFKRVRFGGRQTPYAYRIVEVCQITDNEECAKLALEKKIPEKLIELIKLKIEKNHSSGNPGNPYFGIFMKAMNTISIYLEITDLKEQVVARFMDLELDIILLEILENCINCDDSWARMYISEILETLVENNQITKYIIKC